MRYRARALAADVIVGFQDNRRHTLSKRLATDDYGEGEETRNDESEGFMRGWLAGWLAWRRCRCWNAVLPYPNLT